MSVEERLARVETKVDVHGVRLERIEGKLDEVSSTLKHQRGFITGAATAISVLWATVAAIVITAWKNIVGGDS